MSIDILICTVPGVVSDLTSQPKFTSVVLTWSAPQEPNGVIISYEVTYRVSDGNLVITNTTDLRFTIPSLTPGTNVTEISVSAYTSVGRGDPVQIPHLVTLTAPREYTPYRLTNSPGFTRILLGFSNLSWCPADALLSPGETKFNMTFGLSIIR